MSTQNNYYIRNRKGLYLMERGQSYSTVSDKTRATLWPKGKAHNRASHLPKFIQIQGPWYLELSVESIVATEVGSDSEIDVKEVLTQSSPKISKELFNTRCNPNVISHFHYEIPEEVLNWTNAILNMSKLQQSSAERLAKLRKMLQDSEYERIDILHLIELQPPLNMYEGYKLYKRLRDNLNARRVVKDEIQAIKVFLESISICELADDTVEEFLRVLEDRKYHMKCRESDFDDSVEDKI